MDRAIVLQVAVCDDTPEDLAALGRLINKNGIAAELHVFESGEGFLATFRAGIYDLVFMDIYMKGMRGIETVEAIRRTDENVVIAFVTSSPEHKSESYSLDALKYLEKPVKEKDVKKTLELALSLRKNRPALTVTEAGGTATDVYLSGIIYFEQQNHVVEVHTTERVITTSQTARLNEIVKRLPSPPFVRCHRSYIVNLDYVQRADKDENCFYMQNSARVDIRRGGFTLYKTEWQNRCMDKAGEI